ncbi:2447_t:CDS:10 [Paraglomus brasilianum]|uniref:Actin-like protein ARP6 n=1 Tax=Paraglomus brasilianum TaxID=144538 RepID=A0A9N8VLS4_9GLOM|nr:2447_t:CDS:10 [Paraglomus brasilianum]
MADNPILVMDNGASTIKAGYAKQPETLHVIPNCKVTRGKGEKTTFTGDQLHKLSDYAGLYYRLPFEKGYLTNWEVQKSLWDRTFSRDILNVNPTSTSLLITEPCFNFPNIQHCYDEMIFEAYEFYACCRVIAPYLCGYNNVSSLFPSQTPSVNERPDCILVVDSGYSFTHIVPIVVGRPVLTAVRRINIGGKLLTNHLKEIVSFRHWDMMDQTYVVNEIKETCCYVSKDFLGDLDTGRRNPKENPIVQEYVLPDFSRNSKGYVRDKKRSSRSTNDIYEDQVLRMNNERFTIPELLFHPSNIGMNQAGIPETIVESVSLTHSDLHGLFYSNIVLVGGNASFPGYKERIEQDLRVLAPSEYEVRVGMPENPITYTWHGGSNYAGSPDHRNKLVTRAEYMEHGSNICLQRFGMSEDVDGMQE